MKPTPEDLDNRDEINAQLRQDVATYGFRFRCAECVHVIPSDRSCSLGYPNDGLTGPVVAIDDAGRLTFCKYFELS